MYYDIMFYGNISFAIKRIIFKKNCPKWTFCSDFVILGSKNLYLRQKNFYSHVCSSPTFQAFGLLKDPSVNNNYRIKFTHLRLRSLDHLPGTQSQYIATPRYFKILTFNFIFLFKVRHVFQILGLSQHTNHVCTIPQPSVQFQHHWHGQPKQCGYSPSEQ